MAKVRLEAMVEEIRVEARQLRMEATLMKFLVELTLTRRGLPFSLSGESPILYRQLKDVYAVFKNCL